MPSLFTGLRFHTPQEKLTSEAEFAAMIDELRKDYYSLNSQFNITTLAGEPVINFDDFLDEAMSYDSFKKKKTGVVLSGTGSISGLEFKDSSLEFELTTVGKVVQYWDQGIQDDCWSCTNFRWVHLAQDETAHGCAIYKLPIHVRGYTCKDYDAKIKNAEGKAGRPLAELITEAKQ